MTKNAFFGQTLITLLPINLFVEISHFFFSHIFIRWALFTITSILPIIFPYFPIDLNAYC